jgi:hypothetical protein
MLDLIARWSMRLYGSPCWVCGRPASILWVLADARIIQHGGGESGGPVCRMPNPRVDEPHAPEEERPSQSRAA